MICRKQIRQLKKEMVMRAEKNDNDLMDEKVQEISRKLDDKILEYYRTMAKAPTS